jgi:hypothetical protein
MTKGKPRNKPGSDEASCPPAQAGTGAAEPHAGQPAKNPAAVALGRLGGLKGGPARARKLTKQQRSQIARKAAQSRWAKRRPP